MAQRQGARRTQLQDSDSGAAKPNLPAPSPGPPLAAPRRLPRAQELVGIGRTPGYRPVALPALEARGPCLTRRRLRADLFTLPGSKAGRRLEGYEGNAPVLSSAPSVFLAGEARALPLLRGSLMRAPASRSSQVVSRIREGSHHSGQAQTELLGFRCTFSLLRALGSKRSQAGIASSDPHPPRMRGTRLLSEGNGCPCPGVGPAAAPRALLLRGPDKSISYGGCVTQLYVFLWLGATECILLVVMAFDRYVASTFTLQLPLCGHREVDNFLCEVPAMLKLACGDTRLNEAVLNGVCTFFTAVPLSTILVSYCYIARAVLRIGSAEGRRKAFHTCLSHLLVVLLFYGSAIYGYLLLAKSSSQDQGKFISLFYSVVTPMVNPIIYTLRNKELRSHGEASGLLLTLGTGPSAGVDCPGCPSKFAGPGRSFHARAGLCRQP
ncbi:Olfactory receptor 15 [Galemys pyrenaicus]|uniref:Olfactory receptor 15 n=1 Tax=Galemys pyrenaicus TaxID=202257 RepID=A0A8J5ZSA0_GALPY|nr:Olfactory receptor 15 [Galemys pyrenaicus]